jgi:adenine-specific DNA-methyltransferase
MQIEKPITNFFRGIFVGLAVGYMGTKRHLASAVATVIDACPRGPALDAFSGMCAVGEALGTARIVWNNDAQIFASEVAKAFFTSSSAPPTPGRVSATLYDKFLSNKLALQSRFELRLQKEELVLQKNSLDEISDHQSGNAHVGNDLSLEEERRSLCLTPGRFPYRLCAVTFSDAYFSLLQAIEIDSIRYSIDAALSDSEIDKDEHRWLLIALCQAAVRVSTTTGHFAQYIKPNPNNFSFFCTQRRKSLWQNWLDCIASLIPHGPISWRKKNKVFNEDSLDLLARLNEFKKKPAVVYADPPYTDDQYSRYYHLWETITLYVNRPGFPRH